MRTTILAALALVTLSSVTSAQKRQLSAFGTLGLLGEHSTVDSSQDLDDAANVAYGFGGRLERMVGIWSIGVQYEWMRQTDIVESKGVHRGGLWMRFRAPIQDRFGLYLGTSAGGAYANQRLGWISNVRGFYAQGVVGFDARFRHLGFFIEAGFDYQHVFAGYFTRVSWSDEPVRDTSTERTRRAVARLGVSYSF